LVGTTVAACLWAHHNYKVGVDFNFKPIALARSAAAILIVADMFFWGLSRGRAM